MNIPTNSETVIKIPDNMTNDVAQQCFFIGLKNLIFLNNSGVLISYHDNGNIKTTALRGDAGAILVKFMRVLIETEKFVSLTDKVQTGQTKQAYLQRNGQQLLDAFAAQLKEKQK